MRLATLISLHSLFHFLESQQNSQNWIKKQLTHIYIDVQINKQNQTTLTPDQHQQQPKRPVSNLYIEIYTQRDFFFQQHKHI